ncbi:MAG: hypothetical protein U0W24_16630 [Bacteroidales bacterium]
MKPTKILLFVLLILSGLLCISFLFPKEGIKITDSWVLYFPTIDDLMEEEDEKVVDITEIITKNQIKDESGSDDRKQMVQITLSDSSIIYYEPKKVDISQVSRKIEFPENDKSVIYPFFKELSEVQSNGRLIRILHYGDSQIEADRISSYLRSKIQGQFGGSGPGLIPAVQPYGFDSPVKLENSGGWMRFTGFGIKDSMVKHNRYGVLASFSRYSPYSDTLKSVKDSLIKHHREKNEWIKIMHSPISNANVKKYTQCRLFYGYNKLPVNIKIYAGDEEFDKSVLLPANNLQVRKWMFGKTPSYLKLEFNGYDSPDIFAIALDGLSGVAVDNIPLRGSSGLVFTNSSESLLQAIYQNLNAKLLILQFGGNVAPNMKDNYDFYQQSFYNQLIRLKKLIPGVSIIVIGIADMSIKEKDKYVSYPNVTLIRDALKKASFKANCAYWDTYEAMGGKNSMPSWVFSDPALAEKDFIHFTADGSKIIAQMFYQALMFEYNEYFEKVIKSNYSLSKNLSAK